MDQSLRSDAWSLQNFRSSFNESTLAGIERCRADLDSTAGRSEDRHVQVAIPAQGAEHAPMMVVDIPGRDLRA